LAAVRGEGKVLFLPDERRRKRKKRGERENVLLGLEKRRTKAGVFPLPKRGGREESGRPRMERGREDNFFPPRGKEKKVKKKAFPAEKRKGEKEARGGQGGGKRSKVPEALLRKGRKKKRLFPLGRKKRGKKKRRTYLIKGRRRSSFADRGEE